MTTSVRRAGTAGAFVLAATLVAGCSGGSAPRAASPAKASTSASASAAALSVTTLVQTGINQAQSGDLASASTTFGNALVLDPDNKFALYNLGLIAQTRQRPAAAATYYDAALKADPAYTPAMYNKAIMLEATDLAGAATLYQRIVGLNPQASTAYLRLGFAEAELGQAAAAKTARAAALRLDPSLADVPAPHR